MLVLSEARLNATLAPLVSLVWTPLPPVELPLPPVFGSFPRADILICPSRSFIVPARDGAADAGALTVAPNAVAGAISEPAAEGAEGSRAVRSGPIPFRPE